ncbi:hypothetical protein UO65_4617 [Actinokineospora spheciospongiae]|uniref:DUF3558 domain-containing protein n=1 Tax=Actinokineospora spheciospongiae TaxID=909613 RepID=W7IUI0_9PSEU|nr:hypothetical protein UO65_4617 [Actinokineospora spheciospongiae]
MFTDSIKARLGITGSGTPNSAPSSEACRWKVDKGTVADSYTIGVVVFPKLGLDEVVSTGEKTPVQVADRRAIQSLRAAGSVCAISVEVTATSRVDVQITGDDATALCPKALEAAELIEPALP